MKWLKNKPDGENVNYWQTISDVMSALLLIILLVMLLLILYVTLVPQNDNIDDEPDAAYTEAPHTTDDDDDWDAPYWLHRDDDDAGGGGGHNEIQPQGEDRHDEEPGDKAAVYVRLIDGETGRIIRAEGIAFSLIHGGKQTALNTYYPIKVSYKEFATTEEGVFYLPEKIRRGSYALRELSAPYGYDPAADVAFSIDEPHDWDEPYVIDVMLFHARNLIRLRAEDAATGEGLSGGLYEIYAAEDVYTADGTLRCAKGTLADSFSCDETGSGQSVLLYPGEYSIVQREAPEYYADKREPMTVRLGRQIDGREPELTVIACDRTTYVLTVQDELYPAMKLAGATFEVTGAGATTQVQTDAAGTIKLERLRRGSTYTLRQVGSAEGYAFGSDVITVTVDEAGYIGAQASGQGMVANRILRVEIAVRDVVLQNGVADCGAALYDASGTLIRTWTTTAAAEKLEGLAPGTYRLAVSGGAKTELTFTVEDMPEVQHITCSIWSSASVLGIVGIGVVLIALIVTVVLLLVRRKRRK